MASREAACLHHETRLDVDPASEQSTIDIVLPSSITSSSSERPSPKRRRIDRVTQDEESFSRRYLATESSIYFCGSKSGPAAKYPHPRSILWRVLEEQRVLELQVVDLIQDEAQKDEPLLMLRFEFPVAIRPNSVCFAGPAEEGPYWALTVFVLTDAAELHTLTLNAESFVKPSAMRRDATSDWHACHTPNAFSYKTPFRLIAQNDGVLWASLNNGALVKLEKYHGHYQWSWRETFFTEGGWTASLKDFIPWKHTNTIQSGDMVLRPSAAVSIAISPDQKHLWTVCLDHTIKAWNISTGKVVQYMDLAGNTERDLSKPYTGLLEATNMQLLQIRRSSCSQQDYVLLTFSPVASVFKFWLVRDADAQDFGTEDMRPDVRFSPSLEDFLESSIWTLESFQLGQARRRQGQSWDLWISVRSGLMTQTLTTTVNLDDHVEEINRAFKNNWTRVGLASTATEELRTNMANPSNGLCSSFVPTAMTEQWLDFLFYPGRFSSSTLETALVIYHRSLGSNIQLNDRQLRSRKTSTRQRVSEVVGRAIMLETTGNQSAAFETYHQEIAQQWHVFYGVIKNLHQRRETLLSLAFDEVQDIPWLVFTNEISPVRSCAELEVLWYNRSAFAVADQLPGNNRLLNSLSLPKNTEIGQFFNAIEMFKKVFSRGFLTDFSFLLSNDSVGETPKEKIQSIYRQTGFAGQVSDDDYNDLTNALNRMGGFTRVTAGLFESVLELLDEKQQGGTHSLRLARYGARALVSGARDTIHLTLEIILSMMVLVVFMAAELEEADLPPNFDADAIFQRLSQAWQQQQVLLWLSNNTRMSGASHERKESNNSRSLVLGGESEMDLPIGVSLLESVFIKNWSSILSPAGLQGDLITYWCRVWTFESRLQEQYNVVTCHIMGELVGANEDDLAISFLRFLPDGPWSNYLQARLALKRSEFEEAAVLFRLASTELSNAQHFDVDYTDSTHLLTSLERAKFGEGLCSYYRHVEELFAGVDVMSHTVDFCQLALESFRTEKQTDTAMHSDLLSRLFDSELRVLRYQDAFVTLVQYTDIDLQRDALHRLLHSLLANSRISLFLSLAFPPELAGEVDSYLVGQAAMLGGAALSSDASSTAPAHHKILYAWRIGRADYRGAASCVWERLQAVKQEAEVEVDDEEVAELFLTLLNALSLLDPAQAWMLTRPPLPRAGAVTGAGKLGRLTREGEGDRPKRKVVTLEDVRAMWQAELDRVADVEAGRFPMPLRFGAQGSGGGEGKMVDAFA